MGHLVLVTLTAFAAGLMGPPTVPAQVQSARNPVMARIASRSISGNLSSGGNRLALTPPMGWDSWNKFGCNINETLIKQIADSIALDGMKDAGYKYVIIDDCWLAKSRDSTGHLVADSTRFPNGIKPLADYVHSLGLKLGIYEDRGFATCQGYPGSYRHEALDAQTFASWGVDYLKYDNCNPVGDLETDYTTMRSALDTCGRPIIFSICSWSFPGPWVLNVGNLWRTTGDITDSWSSMVSNMSTNAGLAKYAGPGHWNDPDMLEVGNGGMTTNEYRTEFTMWAEMAAPLIAGNDLRDMTPAIKSILENRDVIAIDQDSLGIQGVPVWSQGGLQIWSKPLRDSSRAVVLLNLNSTPAKMSVSWKELGLNGDTALVQDLWQHTSGIYLEKYFATVRGHGVVMLKIITGGSYDTLSLDISPPTQPRNLKVSVEQPYNEVNISWSSSADDREVAGYDVYGNNMLLETTADTSCVITNLSWDKHYVFTVQAFDHADNLSSFGDTVGVNIGDPPDSAYLSDLTWLSATAGWGTVQRDKSVGGNTLIIGGVTYKKGIGTHAVSEIDFLLNKAWDRFTSYVGVDQEVGTLGSVEFSVLTDGVKKYDSGLMTGRSRPQSVNLDVTGVDTLSLCVGDGGDGINYDHADWCDAEVTRTSTGITGSDSRIPSSFSLKTSYPNPFNPSTTISYVLPSKCVVTLDVYDILGRRVATLLSRVTEASGAHSVTWNADDRSSGVYVCRLTMSQANGKQYMVSSKMVLLK